MCTLPHHNSKPPKKVSRLIEKFHPILLHRLKPQEFSKPLFIRLTKTVMETSKDCIQIDLNVVHGIKNDNNDRHFNFRPGLLVGCFPWTDPLNDWIDNDWIWFTALVLKKFNLTLTQHIMVSYKLNKIPTRDISNINRKWNTLFQQLITKNSSFYEFFTYSKSITFLNDQGTWNDFALFFDTNYSVYKYCTKRFGVTLRDYSKYPALTHYMEHTPVIRDHLGKYYNSIQEYFFDRIWKSIKRSERNKNRVNFMCNKLYQLCKCILIETMTGDHYSLPVIYKQTRQWCHENQVPYRWMVEFTAKKCQACGRRNGDKRKGTVVKMKKCECLQCFVCDRHCQKIAWKNGHRDSCVLRYFRGFW
eukprot:116092_1